MEKSIISRLNANDEVEIQKRLQDVRDYKWKVYSVEKVEARKKMVLKIDTSYGIFIAADQRCFKIVEINDKKIAQDVGNVVSTYLSERFPECQSARKTKSVRNQDRNL